MYLPTLALLLLAAVGDATPARTAGDHPALDRRSPVGRLPEAARGSPEKLVPGGGAPRRHDKGWFCDIESCGEACSLAKDGNYYCYRHGKNMVADCSLYETEAGSRGGGGGGGGVRRA